MELRSICQHGTPDKLARYLNTTPQLWLNLQKAYELRVAELQAGKDIAKQVKPRQEAA